MTKKIKAWNQLGPRLQTETPLEPDELIEDLTKGTNQSKGSVLDLLAELDSLMENALKSGRAVHLPNGMYLRPIGQSDGSIEIHVRVNPELLRNVNAGFRGTWINPGNIGKNEAEIMAQWNAAHPDDPIEK
ncbi:MAG: hypothetical protein WA821_00250 [Anaerolineales bacterium]